MVSEFVLNHLLRKGLELINVFSLTHILRNDIAPQAMCIKEAIQRKGRAGDTPRCILLSLPLASELCHTSDRLLAQTVQRDLCPRLCDCFQERGTIVLTSRLATKPFILSSISAGIPAVLSRPKKSSTDDDKDW